MSNRDKIPLPDLAETVAFLEGLPGSATEHLAVIQEGRAPIARTFARNEISEAIDWLEPFQGVQNCYFHPNPLATGVKNRKARREDVEAARLLHVDIDDLGALDRIKTFPIPPSVVLMSGGGYQCLWFLAEPNTDLPRVELLNRKIAEVLGGDSCHSADHLMRLPGTLNVPNAGKRAKGRTTVCAHLVTDLTDFSRAIAVEDFERGLAQLGVTGAAKGKADNLPIILLSADDIPVDLPPFVVNLIRHGDDLAHPIGGQGSTYRSRSEVVFRVACELAKAEADERTIVGVLTNPANGISASILERADPASYALRQARQAARATGDGWPNVNKGGSPLSTFANALVAVSRLGLRFEYDEFRNRKRVDGYELQDLAGELTDDNCALIRHAVLSRWGFDPGKEHVRDAAHTLCIENTVHPVREYLDGLTWDGKPRLATWLTTYLGAEDTPLHRAMGELVLVAAVRRVRRPGTKFDSILVLEGRQGSGKSTAISVLASDAYFSDQEILTLDAKSQMEALEGVWLYELGELQGLNRAETDRVKAFASRLTDRGRLAYARFREDRPRQTIFIGTTNDEQYLRDATGNRRFWPVKTGLIDLDGLRRDRDQLWAEAAHLEADGRSVALPEDLWGTAAEAQEARLMDDPWLDGLRTLRGIVEGEIDRVTTADALAHLQMPPERQNQAAAKRLGPLMRKLGWAGPKQLRISGRVLRGYERPSVPMPESEF